MYSNPFIGMYSSGRFEFGGKFYHNSVWVYLVYIFATTENEDKENTVVCVEQKSSVRLI